jgi:hypothetical protein
MKTSYRISKAIRALSKTDFKRIFSAIQRKNKRKNQKGELYSNELNSLLFQMYLQEEEDLFV